MGYCAHPFKTYVFLFFKSLQVLTPTYNQVHQRDTHRGPHTPQHSPVTSLSPHNPAPQAPTSVLPNWAHRRPVLQNRGLPPPPSFLHSRSRQHNNNTRRGGAVENEKAGVQGAPAYFLSILYTNQTNRTTTRSKEGHAPPRCILPISTRREGVRPLAIVFFILTQRGGGLLPSFLHTQPLHLSFSLPSALSFARSSTQALDFAKPGLASLASARTHDPSTSILPNRACRCSVFQKRAWLPCFCQHNLNPPSSLV